MPLPSWIRERPERVRREDVIMELPPVSSEEWIEAASQYQQEAARIAFAIESPTTEVDELLNQADHGFQHNADQSHALMRSAVDCLREVTSADSVRGWVRAAMVAANSSDSELQIEIAREGTARLLEHGLDSVAKVFRNYPEIQKQYGPETARALGSGMLMEVDSWCLQNAMATSVHPE